MIVLVVVGGAAACLLGALAPVLIHIQAGQGLSLWVGFLGFRRDITAWAVPRFRSLSGLRGLLRGCGPALAKARRVRLRLRFSGGDAAQTALIHGGLCAALAALPPLACTPELNLEPAFSSQGELALDCDISLGLPLLARIMAGHIRQRAGSGFIREVKQEKLQRSDPVFDPNQFKETVLESIKSLVDANVVIGQAIVSGSVTIIPVFKASIGLISGGASPGEAPLGGGGAGVSVTPASFIVIEQDSVRILSAGDSSPLERLVEAAPALIDKLTTLLSDQ